MRDFARASGPLAKTDRVDAEMIARYGAFARPPPMPLPGGTRQALAELLAYRRQLTAEITARTQQLGHLVTPTLRQRAVAALVASRSNPILRTLYTRLITRGKPPKVALVALMHKMLTTLNAMLRTATPWRQLLSPSR